MKTKILNEIKKGKYYYYELEDTLFYVEGGGQLKDEGTIDGVEVLSCFESEGHIYHQTDKPIVNMEVEIVIDEAHRYISQQGHTAQHLLSAAMYELYGISTVSHHYNLEGSYIDVDTKDLTEEQLNHAENWVNEKIRDHREIKILFPTKEEFDAMDIHHDLKVTNNIRIVHIQGVEYNPCKGMHVANTSEVGMLVILGLEHLKGIVRIHYMFGEVARNHFHLYHRELKKIATQVSKPMGEVSEGTKKLQIAKEIVEKQYSDLANQYVELYAKQYENETLAIIECDLDGDLLNKLCLQLTGLDQLQCYLFTSKQVIATAGKNAVQNAKEMFDELKNNFTIRGGGNPKICRGTSEALEDIKKFVLTLKNG